jgi:hypothetical protein
MKALKSKRLLNEDCQRRLPAKVIIGLYFLTRRNFDNLKGMLELFEKGKDAPKLVEVALM